MKLKSLTIPLTALAIALNLASSASAASTTYYLKYWGSAAPWYTSDNSWGVISPNSSSCFVAMVVGTDWGTQSPWLPIPKKISALGTAHSWFSQGSSPGSGSYYDATYDIFIDPSNLTGNYSRQSVNEIMIWLKWNSQPLSDSWNPQGQAVPKWTNQTVDGNVFDVYYYTWPGGGRHTMSFLLKNQQGWYSGNLTNFFTYAIGKGQFTSSQYLNSVMAGWEFGYGSFTAYSWGNSNF
jgi:hypothetical protein